MGSEKPSEVKVIRPPQIVQPAPAQKKLNLSLVGEDDLSCRPLSENLSEDGAEDDDSQDEDMVYMPA